jgi:DinB superfamily
MRQHDLAVRIEQRNRAVIERARRVQSADPERLRRRPAAEAWSPAEIFEHMTLADDSYLACMRPLIDDARRDGAGDDDHRHRWRPTLMGRLLVWALGAPMKVRTVSMLEPKKGGQGDVIGGWIERRDEIGRLLVSARPLHWRRRRFTSPIAAVIRPNLGDAFLILVTHAERHLDQIDSILARP